MSFEVVEMLRRLAVEAPVSTSSTVRVSYLDGEKGLLLLQLATYSPVIFFIIEDL